MNLASQTQFFTRIKAASLKGSQLRSGTGVVCSHSPLDVAREPWRSSERAGAGAKQRKCGRCVPGAQRRRLLHQAHGRHLRFIHQRRGGGQDGDGPLDRVGRLRLMSQAVVRWGAALSAFKNNKDVVFGDVNLSGARSGERHGVQFNPGAGGSLRWTFHLIPVLCSYEK